jgi:hypothetical protein
MKHIRPHSKWSRTLRPMFPHAVIKTRTIAAINEFFALNNFDFGDTFYFTELAAYIHNQLAPDLLTVVIVPNQSGQAFGSLFQISSAADEIFISGATVDDVHNN